MECGIDILLLGLPYALIHGTCYCTHVSSLNLGPYQKKVSLGSDRSLQTKCSEVCEISENWPLSEWPEVTVNHLSYRPRGPGFAQTCAGTEFDLRFSREGISTLNSLYSSAHITASRQRLFLVSKMAANVGSSPLPVNAPSQSTRLASGSPVSTSECDILRIPPEVLKVVAEGAGGHALACLWRCCNPLLNRKLASQYGVQVFDLWLPNTSRMDRFPSLLKDMQGLTTIRIELRKDVGSMPVMDATLLATLPKTIQEISFRFKEAEECWMRPIGRRTMEPWQTESEVFVGVDPFDFAAHFPHLHTLKLVAPSPHQNNIITKNRYKFGIPVFGILSDQQIAKLPHSSLTVLELPSNNVITAYGMSLFPRTLFELNLQWTTSFQTAEHVAEAFSGFGSLRVLQLGKTSTFQASWVPHLPQTLEYLDLNRCTSFKGPELQLLPRTLTHLDIEFSSALDAPAYLKDLPPKLIYLNIGLCSNVTGASLADLPPNLTFLDIWCATSIYGLRLSNLPQKLKTLKLGGSKDVLDKADMETLPRGLTHLNLESNTSLRDDAIESMPRTLITLIMRENNCITPHCFQMLPKSLTILDTAKNTHIAGSDWTNMMLPEGVRLRSLAQKAPVVQAGQQMSRAKK